MLTHGHVMHVLSGDPQKIVTYKWRKVAGAKRLPYSTQNKMDEAALYMNMLV